MTNNTAPVIAVVGAGEDEAYEGNSIYVVANATVLNGLNPNIIETQWFKDGVADGTGSIYTIGADDETKVITAKQLFRDGRSNELLSEVSNEITIVARPADAITFDPVITDDGTVTGNQVGKVLTASATNILGGIAASEYAYQWKSAGTNTGTAKTYTLQTIDINKIITCDITVAEPDGSNPETRTATYSKTIEPAGTINKPTVLGPSDGAGSGVTRDIVTDAITAVEGGGIKTCETDLIESVSSQSTSSLYIMTTTPSALSDVLANGTPYQEGAEIEFGEYLVRVNNEGPITGTVFAENPSVLGLYDAADSTTGCFNEFGVQIPTLAGSYNNAEWTNMELKTEAPNIAAFSYYTFFTDSSVAYQVYRFGTAGNTAGETDNLPALAAGSLTTLTFPSSQGFDCFEPGDVVQDPDVKVISKDDSDPFTITVDGGDWKPGGTGPNFSSQLKITRGSFFGGTPEAWFCFDGDETTVSYGDGVPGEAIWTPVGGYPVTSNIEIRSGSANDYAAVDMGSGYGSDVATPNGAWTEIFAGSGTLKALKISDPAAAIGFAAIRIDGNILTDGPIGEDKLVKETPYDTKLTVDGSTDLADMTGAVLMTDGNPAGGPYTQTPYKLTTTDIESVVEQTTYNLLDTTGIAEFAQGNSYTGNISSIQSLDATSLTILETVDFGSIPAGGNKLQPLLWDLGSARTNVSIVRSGTLSNEDFKLWGSNDGTNWTFITEVNPLDSVGINSGNTPYRMLAMYQVTGGNFTGGMGDHLHIISTETAGSTTLTFPGDVSTNPDLQYFKAGDTVGEDTSNPGSYTTYAIRKQFDS